MDQDAIEARLRSMELVIAELATYVPAHERGNLVFRLNIIDAESRKIEAHPAGIDTIARIRDLIVESFGAV